MSAKEIAKLSVLEKFLLPNPLWLDGYKSFNALFSKPLGWLFLIDDVYGNRLIRLDRKDYFKFYAASESNQKRMEEFLIKYCELYAQDESNAQKFPCFLRDAFGHFGAIFSMVHLGSLKGFLILSGLKDPQKNLEKYLEPLNCFLDAQVELAYRAFELNNFYETIHPRALALSTMHSVHRVISSSLRLKDLLPKIGRLCAQVLKASGCAILLCDTERQYLIPYFSFGSHPRFVHAHRVPIGRGIMGRMVKTADFHFTKKTLGVPFIEDDVVGVIFLWNKLDGLSFTRMDLDILKSLSEQSVVAIKNAQLYEETEALTLGSIKAISELLQFNFGRQKTELPLLLFLTLRLGMDLGLSQSELTSLERAMMLVDVGVLLSPEKLWQKKGRLTKREYDLIKQIPLRGANLLKSIASLKPYIPVIMHSRERYDGKGYPSGLKGNQIPIGARIIAVVDSFVAMVSHREYKEVKSIEDAIDEIQRHQGTQFDPNVVEAFLILIEQQDVLTYIRAMGIQKILKSRVKLK